MKQYHKIYRVYLFNTNMRKLLLRNVEVQCNLAFNSRKVGGAKFEFRF